MSRLVLMAMVGLLAGCVGYTTYPPEDGQWAGSDPNGLQLEAVMAASLHRVITDHPPPDVNGEGARLAINLPAGLHPIRYERVVEKLGLGSVALTEESSALPRYSVKTIRLRAKNAEVDVFRPVYASLSGPDTQMITVTLTGGVTPWRVERVQEWAPGAFEPPVPYYLMSVEQWDADLEAAREAERAAKQAEKDAKKKAAEEDEG